MPTKTTINKEKIQPKKTVSNAKKEKVSSKSKQEDATIKKIENIDTDIVELHCIADAMLEKKGNNVCSLNLKKIGTAISDYFVVCNADSTTNVLAIADNIEEMMLRKCNRKVVRMQGRENAFWIILDYTNIVVHIFQTEYRLFYRLEDLWADSEKTIYKD
ncbi:MAG: ribosome silencing factor [Rikenellaceae bacterium]